MSYNRRYSGGNSGSRNELEHHHHLQQQQQHHQHHRNSVAPYPNMPVNGMYATNSIPNHLANNPNNPNLNGYVVTQRVEKQYSVQVVPPAAAPIPTQQRHQSPIAPVAPIQHISPSTPSPTYGKPSSQQPEVYGTAVVPYTPGNFYDPSQNHNNNHAGTRTHPPSSTPVQDISMPELEQAAELYKLLGESLGSIFLKGNKHMEMLIISQAAEKRLQAEKEVLKEQIEYLEKERENTGRIHEEKLAELEGKTDEANRDCVTWRDNAMQLNTQLEDANIKLATNVQLVKEKEEEINELKTKLSREIEELKQQQKMSANQVQSLTSENEKKGQEIKEQAVALKKSQDQVKEKTKEYQKLVESSKVLKNDYEKKVERERGKVKSLEGSVADQKGKVKLLEASLSECKSKNRSLEGLKERQEEKIKGLNETIRKGDAEVVRLKEDLSSLENKEKALTLKVKEQTQLLQQSNQQVEEFKKANNELKKNLGKEREIRDMILEEQSRLKNRRKTLLDEYVEEFEQRKLVKDKMENSEVEIQTPQQLPIFEPVSPVEQVPSVEQEQSNENDERGEGQSETENQRKRKMSRDGSVDDRVHGKRRESSDGTSSSKPGEKVKVFKV